MTRKNALDGVVIEAKKAALLEAIQPELDLLKDLARGIRKERDDLDLWLYVDDMEAAATNLTAAVARLRKELDVGFED